MGTAQASNYLENKLVDFLFRGGTFPKPTNVYVALFTAAPSDAGGGTEVAGNNYSRVAVPVADDSWLATQGGIIGASSGTDGVTANAAVITFPGPSGGHWGTIVAFGLFDQATGGNLLIHDVLLTPRNVMNGDPAPAFAAGMLQVSIG